MALGCLNDSIPDMNTLNALTKVIAIVNMCYEKQLDVRNISGNAKDRKMIELRERELDLEERNTLALEKASNIQIVTPNAMDEENKFTPADVYRLFERFVSEKNIDEETKNNLLSDMARDMNVEEMFNGEVETEDEE